MLPKLTCMHYFTLALFAAISVGSKTGKGSVFIEPQAMEVYI